MAAVLLLVVPSFIGAGGQLSTRVRVGELDRVPLNAGVLRITLSKLGGNSIDAHVENLSTEFVPYSPGLIMLVGADNEQIDVLALQSGGAQYSATDRRIAPLARLKQSYVLSGGLRLPVRFYYGDKLLALISE
jgi:hypothetical protein